MSLFNENNTKLNDILCEKAYSKSLYKHWVEFMTPCKMESLKSYKKLILSALLPKAFILTVIMLNPPISLLMIHFSSQGLLLNPNKAGLLEGIFFLGGEGGWVGQFESNINITLYHRQTTFLE